MANSGAIVSGGNSQIGGGVNAFAQVALQNGSSYTVGVPNAATLSIGGNSTGAMSGYIDLDSSSVVSASNVSLLQSGALFGQGTINGTSVSDDGAIHPGGHFLSPGNIGALTVDADVTVSPQGNLDIGVAQSTANPGTYVDERLTG